MKSARKVEWSECGVYPTLGGRDRGLDHVDQLGSIERLVHERNGAGLQTAPADLIAAAARQNDGGYSMSRRLRLEKIQAAHAGHFQVQYQAFHLVAVSGQCKGFGGCESL